jgi:hypothetical protein
MTRSLILAALLLGVLALMPSGQAGLPLGLEASTVTAPLEATSSSSAGLPPLFDDTPDVQCMDVYSETYLFGDYWLVRRDSCSAQLYECPPGYNPPAPPCHEADLLTMSTSTSAGGLSCYMVYTRNDVREYSIVRRTSCSPPEVYQCPYEGAPIDKCHRVTDDLLRAETSASAPAYEPQCMYYYHETSIGPVTHVQRDSCHSETYVCEDGDGVHESSETVDAFVARQVAEPGAEETQSCVEAFLGQYVAWT